MNDKEKEVSVILLEAIEKAGDEEKRLRAVNAYREFMQAYSERVYTDKEVKST